MIKEQDVREAIAECQGERNPNANTCMRLAAFYTILDHITETCSAPSLPEPSYSYAEGPKEYDGDSEFAEAIRGADQVEMWRIMDELMSVVSVTQPRLYAATLRKIEDVKAEF